MSALTIPVLPAGRRERRKHATRADLLAAGRKLFGAKGLYESRIEDLSAGAGIAKGTIYGYFSGKDELVRAVVEAGYRELQDELRAELCLVRGRQARIGRLVRVHARYFEQRRDLLRVLHQARGMLKFDRAEWRPLRSSLDRHLEVLTELLADGRAARLPRALAREQASALFGAMSGAMSVHVALSPRRAGPLLGPSVVGALVALALSFERLPRPERPA
ncbi:MAG: TetR/AcrR family transcriptional regulator [Candidatus Eisenbacteria bacterium]